MPSEIPHNLPTEEIETTPIEEEKKAVGVAKTDSDEPSFFKKWASLLILSLALAIIVIDTTLLNVSFGTILRDLNTDIRSMQWVITGYALILAAFTIVGGKLGDLFGRKKMFVVGAILFAVGSFIASISQNVGTLIWGEAIIEGIGAVLMLPATASLLVSTFKGRERAIAFGVWGGVAAASSALGPILGGYLTTNFNWRWGFRINIVVVIVLVLGTFLIKESRDTEDKVELDEGGIILSSVALATLVYGIVESSQFGWYKAKQAFVIFGHPIDLGGYSIVIPTIIYSLIVLGLFVVYEIWIEKQGRAPLVSMSLFKNRQFSSSVLVTGILTMAQAGFFFIFPIFLQSVVGLDAFHTGIAFLPLSLSILIASPLSGYLTKFISAKRLIQIGVVLAMIAFVILYFSISLTATAKTLILGLSVFGAGFGLFISQTSNIALSAVPVQRSGEASGVNNTLRQLGQSLGSAIIGAVILSVLTSHIVSGIQSSAVIPQDIKSNLVTSIPAQISNIEFGGKPNEGQSQIPETVTQEITNLSHQATVDGVRQALIYSFVIALLGLIAAAFLPENLTEASSNNKATPAAGH